MRAARVMGVAVLGAVLAIGACSDDEEATGPSAEVFKAVLLGSNERPNPVTTQAFGTAEFRLANGVMTYRIDVTGLSGNAVGAHLHGPADASAAAGVMIGFTGLATGTTVRLVSGTLAGSATVSVDSAATLMRKGLIYVNVHTAANPGGEVRGQVVPQ